MAHPVIGSKYYETLDGRVNEIIKKEELPLLFSTVVETLKYKNWRCYSSECGHRPIKPQDLVYKVTPDDPIMSAFLHASCVR